MEGSSGTGGCQDDTEDNVAIEKEQNNGKMNRGFLSEEMSVLEIQEIHWNISYLWHTLLLKINYKERL